MPLDYQQQLFSDFSGGITDKYVIANPNKYKRADNLYITEYDSVAVRGGFDAFYDNEAAVRIMGLWELNDDLFMVRESDLKRFNSSTGLMETIIPVNGGQFQEVMDTTIYPSASRWQNHLIFTNSGIDSPRQYSRPMVAYKQSAGTYKAHEAGLPSFDQVLTYTPNATGAKEYLYAAQYSYSYTVDGVAYRYNSTAKLSIKITTTSDIGGGGSVNITGIAALSGVGTQVDIANVKIELYRTEHGGFTFYRIAQLANGTTSFNDTTTDTDLISGSQMYINDGKSDHTQAPKCKHMTIVGDIAYYAGVLEEIDSGDEFKPYRVVQSIPGSITAIDPSYSRDVDDEIVGISHIGGYPIIFTKTFIYRIDGIIDSFGNGSIRLKVLSDSYGCASANGIVRTNNGLYWAGAHGFYATDGFVIKNLTIELTKSYNKLAVSSGQRDRMHGTYDSENERVYWAVSESDSENNLMWVLNLNPLLRGKQAGFTKFSSGALTMSATLFYKDDLLIGTVNGNILRHNDLLQKELTVNTNTLPSVWETRGVEYDFETSITNFGNPATRKWVSQTTLSYKTETNLAILLTSNNDDERQTRDMKEIRSFGTFSWGDPDFIWGGNDIRWRKPETESKTRHFPRSTMRCRRKQLRVRPARTVVYYSDDKIEADLAAVNPLADPLIITVTLQGTYKWPTDAIGYWISFSDDNYAKEFRIKTRSDTTLTIDSGAVLGIGKKWHIIGIYKKQLFEVKSIAYKYALLDNVGGKFQTGDDGGNA